MATFVPLKKGQQCEGDPGVKCFKMLPNRCDLTYSRADTIERTDLPAFVHGCASSNNSCRESENAVQNLKERHK
jgi:hypothetical protein